MPFVNRTLRMHPMSSSFRFCRIAQCLCAWATIAASISIAYRTCRAEDPSAKSKPAETRHSSEQQAQIDEAEKLSRQMMDQYAKGKFADAEKTAEQAPADL